MEKPFEAQTQHFIDFVMAEECALAEDLLKEHPELMCDRNISGETPLHWLAIENQIAGVRMLLKYGADANSTDYSGDCILYSAAWLGRVEIVSILFAAGVLANLQHSRNGEIALHVAARFSPNPQIVDQLVDAGSDVNAKDGIEWTPLHSAAMHGNIGTAERLLERGANASQVGGFDQTPLDMVNGPDRSRWEFLFKRFERIDGT